MGIKELSAVSGLAKGALNVLQAKAQLGREESAQKAKTKLESLHAILPVYARYGSDAVPASLLSAMGLKGLELPDFEGEAGLSRKLSSRGGGTDQERKDRTALLNRIGKSIVDKKIGISKSLGGRGGGSFPEILTESFVSDSKGLKELAGEIENPHDFYQAANERLEDYIKVGKSKGLGAGDLRRMESIRDQYTELKAITAISNLMSSTEKDEQGNEIFKYGAGEGAEMLNSALSFIPGED